MQGTGEPMELGELAGMTPEIIQKVKQLLLGSWSFELFPFLLLHL